MEWIQPQEFTEHVRRLAQDADPPSRIRKVLSSLAGSHHRQLSPVRIFVTEAGIGNDWTGTIRFTPWHRNEYVEIFRDEVDQHELTLMRVYDDEPSASEYALSDQIDADSIRIIAEANSVKVDVPT